jgi:hypothetical protein
MDKCHAFMKSVATALLPNHAVVLHIQEFGITLFKQDLVKFLKF